MAKKYWLVKSEPEVYSIEDLRKEKNFTTAWDGVRNYQARNFIRDDMKKGDGVLFYYSSTKPNAVVGNCEIVKEGYPDKTQFDPDDEHFFPSADPANPAWYSVDIKFISQFKHPVTLDEIKANPKLRNIRLIQRGNRLSVMPVSKEEFDEIVRMGKL